MIIDAILVDRDQENGEISSNVAKRNGESSFPRICPIREMICMTMSQATSSLSKPESDEQIPIGTLGYFQARNRNRIYDLVLSEFLRSGISQATLARRLGKGTDIVCRRLGAPGNWTLDTVSDLLFGISGAEPEYGLSYPLDGPRRNFTKPEWLNARTTDSQTTIKTDKHIKNLVAL